MSLHHDLLLAHEHNDNEALVSLYTDAANRADTVDSMCFFLTLAYVFALETAHPNANTLHKRLVEHQRV